MRERERERERESEERETSGNITCINVIKFSLKMMHAIGTALPVKSMDSIYFQSYGLWGFFFLYLRITTYMRIYIPALRTVKWELNRAQHAREYRKFIGFFIHCKNEVTNICLIVSMRSVR